MPVSYGPWNVAPPQATGSRDHDDIVWVPQINYWLMIPLEGNPTRSDRPGDMYGSVVGSVDEGYHDIGPAVGVALNGDVIQALGRNDAGAVNDSG